MILDTAGDDIRLPMFDARQKIKFDYTLTRVPDTGRSVMLYWRIPMTQEGLWQKSQAQVSYNLTVGRRRLAATANSSRCAEWKRGAILRQSISMICLLRFRQGLRCV